MVFSSAFFVFLFLPLTLLIYSLSARRWRNVALLLASVIFYSFGEMVYLPLLATSIAVNFAGGFAISASTGRRRLAMLWAWVGLNLAGLLWFKYAGFFAGSVNALGAEFGYPSQMHVPEIVLPLGISFFTFHAISYLVDVYRNKAEVQRNPSDFALYILLFPQLIAGPIIRYHDIATQLQSRCTRLDDAAEGARRFLVGLAKKLLLANPMGAVADAVFLTSPDELSTASAWLGAIAYSLQIYLDFSAYSDMAIGLCRMFGFRIRENFDHPYVARSIQDFWRRWHISLSTWFRDYVYIPLGGNRHGKWRTAFNLLTVFFLCGLWHGAQWTFVLWGLFHGLFLAIERGAVGTWLTRQPRSLQHAYTLLVVVVGWILFRATDAMQAATLLGKMFSWSPGRAVGEFADDWSMLLMVFAAMACTPWLARPFLSLTPGASGWRQAWVACSVLILAMGSMLALFGSAYNPFIYFRF